MSWSSCSTPTMSRCRRRSRIAVHLDDEGVALAVGRQQYIDADGLLCPLKRNGEPMATLLAFHTNHRAGFSLERDFGTYASLIAAITFRMVGCCGGATWTMLAAMLRPCPGRLVHSRALAKKYRIAYAGKVLRDTARTRTMPAAFTPSTCSSTRPASCYRSASTLRCRRPGSRVARSRRALPSVDSAGTRAGNRRPWRRHPSSPPPPPESLGQRIHLDRSAGTTWRMSPVFLPTATDPWVQRYVTFDDGFEPTNRWNCCARIRGSR